MNLSEHQKISFYAILMSSEFMTLQNLTNLKSRQFIFNAHVWKTETDIYST